MRIGIAHVAGKYNYPGVAGAQFTEGCNAIWDLGVRTLKIYCTSAYTSADYTRQTWTGSATTMKQLLQLPEYNAQLLRAWDRVILTGFTFANNPGGVVTNGWRSDASTAYMDAEYVELREAAEYLLTAFNGTGQTFVIQNWEGDWAYMDSTNVDTYVSRPMLDRYAAWLGTRQRAIEDARAAVVSDCTVLHAIELNRVNDARLFPHRRRILTDIASRVQPDVISYSAYDSTIVDQGSWGADLAAWTAATVPMLTKCLRAMQEAFPGVPIQVGEFGFPEGAELPPGRDVGDMIQVVYDICLAEGVTDFIYWEVFDNEETSPGVPRGYYTMKPDGTTSQAGAKLAELL